MTERRSTMPPHEKMPHSIRRVSNIGRRPEFALRRAHTLSRSGNNSIIITNDPYGAGFYTDGPNTRGWEQKKTSAFPTQRDHNNEARQHVRTVLQERLKFLKENLILANEANLPAAPLETQIDSLETSLQRIF